ncbi:hypothetical protein PENTCL1PPCAC_12414 [Pristionchus entomophagus]|uniref:Ribosomal protein n=1 Tax=Pristionchus entomophagus TaxID=358040 RepID=A0AAV5T950_9BILA|nr:hypothetical protein PENTCL1PPCAC_12414 [Pristionchus entomophagus]
MWKMRRWMMKMRGKSTKSHRAPWRYPHYHELGFPQWLILESSMRMSIFTRFNSIMSRKLIEISPVGTPLM